MNFLKRERKRERDRVVSFCPHYCDFLLLHIKN